MNKTIDVKKLTQEFHHACAAEKKYHLENDAKFRAVHQKVSSYEEFKDIVAASGLNPLEKKDIYTNEKVQTNWNVMYHKTPQSTNIYFSPIVNTNTSNHQRDKVSTSSMFLKMWRSFKTSENKKNFLFSFTDVELGKIFEKDIPASVFEDSIEIIHSDFVPDEIVSYAVLFIGFAKSSRINLACSFLTKNQKSNLKEIFGKINSVDSTLLADIQEQFLL